MLECAVEVHGRSHLLTCPGRPARTHSMAEACLHGCSQQSQCLKPRGSDGEYVQCPSAVAVVVVVVVWRLCVRNAVHMAALVVTGMCEMCAVLLHHGPD